VLLTCVRGLNNLDAAGLNDIHTVTAVALTDDVFTIAVDLSQRYSDHAQVTFFLLRAGHMATPRFSIKLPINPG